MGFAVNIFDDLTAIQMCGYGDAVLMHFSVGLTILRLRIIAKILLEF